MAENEATKQKIAADPAVAAFVARAREYCAFVESADRLSLAARLETARVRIVALYGAACSLPFVDAGDFGDEEGVEKPPPKPWSGFDKYDYYWDITNPYKDGAASTGSLDDDALDIYADITRGFALWDSGLLTNAVWEWQFHFEVHWGVHAADALRALHWACSREKK
jgi:hypothetical protein